MYEFAGSGLCVVEPHCLWKYRMEPVFMILGQSAAIAACKAIDTDHAVQDIPYSALKEKLLERGQVLSLK